MQNKAKEVVLKQNYDKHSVIITRNSKEYMKYNDNVPTDFDTLLDYITKNPSKFIDILDGITIVIKIDRRKSILVHKTLFEQVVDLSICNGAYRLQNYMTIPLKLAYELICQYR